MKFWSLILDSLSYSPLRSPLLAFTPKASFASEEAFQFSAETAELAIAHTNKNKTEAAYRRGDQLERRRELMTEWERYIMSNMARGVQEI